MKNNRNSWWVQCAEEGSEREGRVNNKKNALNVAFTLLKNARV